MFADQPVLAVGLMHVGAEYGYTAASGSVEDGGVSWWAHRHYRPKACHLTPTPGVMRVLGQGEDAQGQCNASPKVPWWHSTACECNTSDQPMASFAPPIKHHAAVHPQNLDWLLTHPEPTPLSPYPTQANELVYATSTTQPLTLRVWKGVGTIDFSP